MRVLNITDLHIVPSRGGHIYGVDPFVSLQGMLDAGMALNPDLVIARGDLVEHSDSASYLRLRQLLSATALAVFVLPGNHDSPS